MQKAQGAAALATCAALLALATNAGELEVSPLRHDARGETNSRRLRLQDVAQFTRSPEERAWARSHLK